MLAAAPEVGGGKRNDRASVRFPNHAPNKKTPAPKGQRPVHEGGVIAPAYGAGRGIATCQDRQVQDAEAAVFCHGFELDDALAAHGTDGP